MNDQTRKEPPNAPSGEVGSQRLLGIRFRIHHPHVTDRLYYVDQGGAVSQDDHNAKTRALRFNAETIEGGVAQASSMWPDCKMEIQICTLPSWRLRKRIFRLPSAGDQT